MAKAFVYLGPSRPFGLPIMKNAILAGEPEAVYPQGAKIFEERKNLRRLFVPVKDLAIARAALANAGSALSLAAAQVKKESDEYLKEAK